MTAPVPEDVGLAVVPLQLLRAVLIAGGDAYLDAIGTREAAAVLAGDVHAVGDMRRARTAWAALVAYVPRAEAMIQDILARGPADDQGDEAPPA